MGQLEDVAGLVSYIASKESSFVMDEYRTIYL
jgi:hypothetical protein